MFIGHFAAGFAGKHYASKVNLAWLVIAGALVDLVWTVLLLSGIEHARIVPGLTQANPLDLYDFPWSHSLLADLGWAALAGALWWGWRKDARGAVVIGAVVFSHWVLDLISHTADLPLWPASSIKVGLGLWRSLPATLIVEGTIWLVGLAIYVRATRPLDRRGGLGLWVYAALMTALFAMSFAGPPPPDVQVVAYVNLTIVPLLLWPAWFDRHRIAPKRI